MEASISNLEELLCTTENWWEDYHHSHHSSEEKVNIFRILEVSDKEVAMCRMLTDLMGNTKRHTNAKRYLKMFLKDVLKLEDLPEDFVTRACVDKEYLIPGTDRRIDLAIYTMDYFIPIEAKIYAVDQSSQCYDYYQYAKGWNKSQDRKTVIYYLTLYGKEPSEESISKKDNDKVIDRLSDTACEMISWKYDIVPWLKKILKEMDTGSERDVTEQYLEVIEEMTGLKEQEKKNEIVDLLTGGEDAFRAALTIGDYISSAKSKNAEVFMRDMKIAMEPVADEFHLKLSDSAIYPCTDFEFRESHFIKYEVTKRNGKTGEYEPIELTENKRLWFVIEIYENLDVGFVVYDSEKNDVPYYASDYREYMDAYINFDGTRSDRTYDGWWVIWDYLRDDKNVPNFRIPNELGLQMADKEKRSQFITEYLKDIRTFLKKYLRAIS